MSASSLAGSPGRRLVPAPLRAPSLRLVPSPGPRAPRAAFVALVLVLLAGGLVGLLVLTTTMQQRAFALFDVQNEIATLREERQLLVAELAQRESPAALARSARLLGMVPNDTPAFLDLGTGRIRGELVPAPARSGAGR
jgi:hypothetical protein